MALERSAPHFGDIGDREPRAAPDPDREYERRRVRTRVRRDGPWRYACPECASVSLTPRTREGGYRCGGCGHILDANERVDRATEEGV